MDEMKNTMQEEMETKDQPTESMADYEAEINASLKKIKNGDLVDGEIIGVNEKEALVNFGYVSDGIILAADMPLDPEQKPNEKYKVGDQVKAEVTRVDDGNGNVLLSINKAASIVGWNLLKEALEAKTPVHVQVVQAIKGGVLCNFNGVKGFMPASLASARFIEDLNILVGQEMNVSVLELDRNSNRILFSRKELEKEELSGKREKFMETLQVGDTFQGVVKKIMDFGAFVNIGCVDGLVRTEDMSWDYVAKPEDVVKEGQEVTVHVVDVDRAKKKIRLAMKDQENNPWNNVEKEYVVGETYPGKVMRIKDFGAFVALASGVEGLVHLSQISDRHIKSAEEVLKVGDDVQVRVLEMNKAEKRIRLTMKSSEAPVRQPKEKKTTAKEKKENDFSALASSTEAMASMQSFFGNIDLKDFK